MRISSYAPQRLSAYRSVSQLHRHPSARPSQPSVPQAWEPPVQPQQQEPPSLFPPPPEYLSAQCAPSGRCPLCRCNPRQALPRFSAPAGKCVPCRRKQVQPPEPLQIQAQLLREQLQQAQQRRQPAPLLRRYMPAGLLREYPPLPVPQFSAVCRHARFPLRWSTCP